MKTKTPYQRQVQAEFNTWRNSRNAAVLGGTGPVVPEPGWLPDGWEFVVAAPTDWRVRDTDFVDFVVRPSAGGWAAINVVRVLDLPRMAVCEPTLGELYTQVCSLADAGRVGWMPVEETLRHYITNAYDPNDPAEAAERMLVALGGRPVRMPVALA